MSPATTTQQQQQQQHYDKINDTIRKVIPEFTSETKYGLYPMNSSQWLSPASKAPDGKPGFIPQQPQPKSIKQNYVWGPGTRGFGYYHLLTKEAYVILNARLQNEAAAVGCCGCFGGKHNKKSSDVVVRSDELKRIQHIMFARSKSPIPNDGYAKEHAVQEMGATFRPPDDFGIWELKLNSSNSANNNKKNGNHGTTTKAL